MSKTELLDERKISEIVSKVISGMINKKEEKYQYPSEVNTKSIACRVPMVDYIDFIKEAKEQGINMNDWLLNKIYKNVKGEKECNYIKLTQEDFKELIEEGKISYNDSKEFIGTHSKEDIIELCWAIIRKQRIIEQQDEWQSKRIPSLIDAKIQISKIAKERFNDKECRSFMKELNELLKELKDSE